ncbi:MAG: TonB family protein [Bacteroidetes bacterium]|nr:TonB family protein [Bacteroidota bacterium]
MENLLIYMIKVNGSLILFYLCYKLLFQRDTFWMIRRIYLLVSVLFSFIYPLISVEGWIKKQEPVMTAIASIQLDEFIITPEGIASSGLFTLENVLWGVFGLIVISMLLRICVQLISIFKRRLKGYKTELQGIPVIRMDEKITPFSFFKWIFINPLLHTHSETAEILAHEQTHARQWHSVDVFIGQIQTILCWFNPAAWLMEREIRHNLEFLADNQVLKSGFEPKNYQYHLLKLTYEPADSKLINQFNVSPIKKRIKMMNSKKTKKTGLLKYALIVPVALTLVWLSSFQQILAGLKNDTGNTARISLAEASVKDVNPVQTPSAAVATAQQTDKDKKIFEVVETPPEFPGGIDALMKFMAENIKYPAEAVKNKIEGKVILKFVVDDTGKVTDIEVARSVAPMLDAEAIRVVGLMPRWEPGKQKGIPVNVRFALPVAFKLSPSANKAVLEQLEVVGYGKPETKKEGVVVNAMSVAAPDKDGVYDQVDILPAFQGGQEALFGWLSQNIRYPADAQKQGIQGKVLVQYVVDTDGSIKNAKILRGVNELLDKEALRVINTMPNWTPGKHKDKVVKVRYTLPIQFRLQ